MEEFLVRQTCRLCESDRLESMIHMATTPVGDDFVKQERLSKIQNAYPLELSFCRECGLLQLPGVISPENIYGDYLYETANSLGLSRHFQSYVDDVVERHGIPEGSLVVDIGSNDGTLLRSFQKRGMKVLGIEPARSIAEKVTASGVETIASFFNKDLAQEIRQERGAAAIVTANNVFANIDDVNDLVGGVKMLLREDGLFVFETGYMVDLVQNIVLDNIYHEHLCYFSMKPLVKFFARHGMEMIDVQRIPTKGGSIRCVVQRQEGKRPVSAAVTELVNLETELGFDRPTPVKIFVERIENIKKELKAKLQEIRSMGKAVAGYGASVGVTTLLYYFDLEGEIDYLVDDNPAKFDRYSPGMHIPVFSSEVIYERKPDYVLILAWRYADPIVRKHQRYLEQGGRFILPLPAVEMVDQARLEIDENIQIR